MVLKRAKESLKLPTFLKIQENALFVADSHYNEKRPEFLAFLEKLSDSSIQTTQLFLMGDMIDFISGESKYFIKRNKNVINLLNELSKTIEIIYFEGNHDYNLKIIFPNIKIIKREEQPLFGKYQNQKVGLSHGDIFVNDRFYDIYCKVIRNHGLLTFLNSIDFNNWISKKIYYGLLDKKICSKMTNFDKIVEKRVQHYDCDLIIEGHFHQGSEFQINDKRYKNIQSLTCSNEYVRFENGVFIGEKL